MADGGWESPYTGSHKHAVQLRTAPGAYLTLEGSAMRVGYSISPPEPDLPAGVEAVPMNVEGVHYFVTGVIGTGIYPICWARWNLRWFLVETPRGKIGPPLNPLMGAVAGGATKKEYTPYLVMSK